jgi:Domain of unknown function (DUF6285)
MKDISDAVDLMTTGREVLLRDLLPTLPKDRRYAGLMIANAMAIGLREQTSGMTAAREEITRLRKLLPEAEPRAHPMEDADSEAELSRLRSAMCAAIRAGRFDDGAQESALIAHLARTAADWVAISNPKALREPVMRAGT